MIKSKIMKREYKESFRRALKNGVFDPTLINPNMVKFYKTRLITDHIKKELLINQNLSREKFIDDLIGFSNFEIVEITVTMPKNKKAHQQL